VDIDVARHTGTPMRKSGGCTFIAIDVIGM
jgi:hypothetical protein